MPENDYELVSLAQEHDEDAINAIYEKYKPIIIKKSKEAILIINHHGIEINDIMQEAYIGLKEAIDNFKQSDDTTFYTFANLLMDRKIANYIKKNLSGKGKILNEAIAIDETLENILTDDYLTEEEFLFQSRESELIKKLRHKLTDFETCVFDLKLKDYSIKEISNELNREQKSIYNTIQRIKEKLKEIIENDN